MVTTIQIDEGTKELLDRLKIHHRQSYNELIARMARARANNILGEIVFKDEEGDLTEEIKVELEKRRKSNSYISHEEVKRRILAKK